MKMQSNILKNSIQSATISIVFQILSRCITFGINSLVVRIVAGDLLGIINVRLLLLESTLLFLSREAIRRATLSYASRPWPQIVNQLWLTVIACTLFVVPSHYIWLYYLSPVGDNLFDQYQFGCLAVSVSCIIEQIAEVPTFITQVNCKLKLRVALECIYLTVRSVVFIYLVRKDPTKAIIAFAIAQVVSSIAFTSIHYGYYYASIGKTTEDGQTIVLKKFADMFPFFMNQGPIFDKEAQTLVVAFFKQGMLKQLLTEGEKYVMSVTKVLSFSEQATYDIVNNLGSLAARFIFRPIEDNSYFYFTQTITRNVPFVQQDQTKIHQSSMVLSNLLTIVTSIGLIGVAYGQSFAEAVLFVYGGAKFVEDGLSVLLLKWHSLAIILLAINGICEGFMFATMSSVELNSYNYYMGLFSTIFLLLSYQLTRWFGPVGFILANCVNMLLRIVYSLFYIRKVYDYTKTHPLRGSLPNGLFLSALATFAIICKISEVYLLQSNIIVHIGIGGLCCAATVIVWVYTNRNLLSIRSIMVKKKEN